MSHWGYVIEQLISEDEKTRAARRQRRRQREAKRAHATRRTPKRSIE